MYEFSIIVPCYNESQHIKKLLDSFKQQTVENKTFEVIIVDNQSTDNTFDIVSHLKTLYSFSIKCVVENTQGANLARNKGAAEANGKYLVFLDADNTVEQNFLECIQILIDNQYNAGSFYTLPDTKNVLDIAIFAILHFIKKFFKRSFGKSFVRQDIFNRVNGFDESNVIGMNVRFAKRVKSDSQTNYVVCDIPVYASMRRFYRQGYVKTLMHWFAGYLGISRKKLTRKH